MASDGIFLVRDGELVVLQEETYDSEDVLQEVLAKYPQFLAGLTTTGESEQQLLLVNREVGIPTTELGGSTFSIDHVFVGRDAVPVLVEVKRSTDTRIRREVIGQMIDYVANATRYWSPGSLRQTSELYQESREFRTLDQLWPDVNPEEFWGEVDGHLKAGKVRMIFVADRLPANVIRVIEFLNEQMSPAEVLGVELRRFVSGHSVAYVPKYYGQTVAAGDAKLARGSQWTKEEFVAQAINACVPEEFEIVDRLLTHGEMHGTRFTWGTGVKPGMTCWYEVAGQTAPIWSLSLNVGKPSRRMNLFFLFQDLAGRRGLQNRIAMAAEHLSAIDVMASRVSEARKAGWQKYPSLFLEDIAFKSDNIAALFAAIDSFRDVDAHPSL